MLNDVSRADVGSTDGDAKAAGVAPDTDRTRPHPTGLLRAVTSTSVFAERCSIVGPDAVPVGRIEKGTEVQALRTISEERTIATADSDAADGITSTICWTLISYAGTPNDQGWVTEQVDGEKIFQRYREVVQDDPPIVSTSPFYIEVAGERYPTFDAAVVAGHHEVLKADTVTIGTCFAAALQPGLEYKFSVAYLGEEEVSCVFACV
jgi:hypothetical protein